MMRGMVFTRKTPQSMNPNFTFWNVSFCSQDTHIYGDTGARVEWMADFMKKKKKKKREELLHGEVWVTSVVLGVLRAP